MAAEGQLSLLVAVHVVSLFQIADPKAPFRFRLQHGANTEAEPSLKVKFLGEIVAPSPLTLGPFLAARY
jgi:hypothetical protein